MEMRDEFVVKEPVILDEEADEPTNQVNYDNKLEHTLVSEDGRIISTGESSNVSSSGTRPASPPYYTQNHNVGGAGKMSKEKKQYNCKFCKCKFTSKAWLVKHEKMHDNMENKSKLYKCEICSKEFTQRIIYLDHKSAHAGLRPYVCDRCGMDFTWYRAFYRHQRSHETDGKGFSCHLCQRTFNNNWNLSRHLKEIHMSQQTFTCDVCCEIFEKKNLFQIHMKAHAREERERNKRNGIVSDKVMKKHLELSKIVRAMIQTKSEDSMEENVSDTAIKPEHEHSESNLAVTLDKSDISHEENVNISVPGQSDLESSETGDEFADLDSQEQEIGSSDGDGQSFVNVSENVMDNMQMISNIDSSIAESVKTILASTNTASMTKSKPQASSNKASMTKSKPQAYTCDICGKSVQNLDSHLRIHSGDKPFSCCLCEKDFSHREALKVHYRSHTGEKPFVCSTCGKGFATRGLQQDHMRAHRGDKPYQCDVCDAKFSWRCALSRHKQLHSTGPKPHVCSVCPFDCWRKNDLLKHEKTHLYDKLYRCNLENCTEVFTNKKHLFKHQKEHGERDGSKSSGSCRNGRITRTQTAINTNTNTVDSNITLSSNLVENIKKEPEEDISELGGYQHNAVESSMYITSCKGVMKTFIAENAEVDAVESGADTQNVEEDTPISGVAADNDDDDDTNEEMNKATDGNEMHVDIGLKSVFDVKQKLYCGRTSGTDSAKTTNDRLKQRNDEHRQNNREQHSSECDADIDTDVSSSNLSFKENQVTITMDNVIEKTYQQMRGTHETASNLVRCEVCGKNLNISYYHIHVRKHMDNMAHVCELCNKSFSRKTDLIVHSRVHTNDRPFKCTTCSKAFKVKALLDDHMRSHEGIRPYVCSLCDASFAWRCALHRHVKTHSLNRPFQCDNCGKDFQRRRDWLNHKEKKSCKYAKSIVYKCNDCQAVFINLETLVYHNEKFHKEALNVTNDPSPQSTDKSMTPSSSFVQQTHVEKEEIFEKNEPTNILKLSLSSKVFKVDMDMSNTITPDENRSAFSNVEIPKVEVNNRSVTGEDNRSTSYGENSSMDILKYIKKEVIADCVRSETVDTDSVFIAQMNSVETMKDMSDISNTDANCTLTSRQKERHSLSSETGGEFSLIDWTGGNLQLSSSCAVDKGTDYEDKLKCKICGRSFVSPVGLKIHLRIHSKDAMDIYALHFRPDEMLTKAKKEKEERNLKYKCKLCDKTFPFASGLRIHMMAHSGRLPYDCKLCGKRFPYLESVKAHMRVHTGERPFTCDVCNKSFAYRHNHDDHYRTHTGDRPHKCDRCDSAFTWKSALHRHHKTHSLENLEVCGICKAKFKNEGQLVRHMNRFHSRMV